MTHRGGTAPAVAGWALPGSAASSDPLPGCGPLEEGTMEWGQPGLGGNVMGVKRALSGAGGSKDFRV